MDNRFAFGLWIFLDLTVIALGAGRLLHRLPALHPQAQRAARRHQQRGGHRPGLLQRRGSVLMVDVGQPLRAWFTFWYPNVHSMLTEVTFCISCYLTVLAIEYLPIRAEEPQAARGALLPGVRVRAAQAGLRAGGRGHVPFVLPPGLAGRPVRRAARPAVRFPRRPGWSGRPRSSCSSSPPPPWGRASSCSPPGWWRRSRGSGWSGPKCSQLLGRISGLLLAVYVLAKTVDTLIWINRTSPDAGFPAAQYYAWKPFGTWILFAEIVLFGLVPALIMLTPRLRAPHRLAGLRRRHGLLRRGAQPLRA